MTVQRSLRRLSRSALLVIAIVIVSSGFITAQSEPGRVLQDTFLLLRPTSREPLLVLAAGARIEIVSVEGPWLKVEVKNTRHGTRTGYVDAKHVARNELKTSVPPRQRSDTVPGSNETAPAGRRGAKPTPAELAAAVREGASSTSAPAPASADSCDTGHWIDVVSGDGKIIKLEDGTLWQVNEVDAITSNIWLPVSNVVICGSKMINVDNAESVEVERLLTAPLNRANSTRSASPGYVIQASNNDETFVINGEVFKAKTYCFNFNQGDRVVFVSGSPRGTCLSAQLVNVRTGKTCNVWCE